MILAVGYDDTRLAIILRRYEIHTNIIDVKIHNIVKQ